jgi:two-component system sensor histidine kinase/response regulator
VCAARHAAKGLEVPLFSPTKLPSIQSKTASLVLACALPTVIGFAALAYNAYERERGELAHQSAGLAKALMLAVDRELDNGETAARALASSPSLASGNLAAFHAQAAALARTEHAAVGFVLSDADGKPLLNTRFPFGAPLPPNGNAARIRAVFADGRAQTSELFDGDGALAHLVSVDVPVMHDGEVAFVLSAQYRPELLVKLVDEQMVPAGWNAAVYDSADALVARNSNMARYLGARAAPALAAAAPAPGGGALTMASREGAQHTSQLARSARRGWYAAIGVPSDAATASVVQALAPTFAAVAALLAVGLLLALSIGGAIGRSVRALCAPAVALGRGEPLVLPPMKFREAAEVAVALEQVEVELLGHRDHLNRLVQERTEELERTAALLATVYATAPVGMGVFDAQLRFVMINDYLAAVNGVAVADHIGRTLPEVVGAVGERVEPAYRAVLETGVAVTGAEMSGPSPGAPGVVRHWIVSYHPIRDHDGAVTGVSAVLLDVSAQKQQDLRMRDQDEQFRALYELSGDAHMLVDRDGGYLGANRAAAALFGCASVDDFLTLSPASVSPEYQADGDRSDERARAHMQQALDSGSAHFEWLHERRDGSVFNADVLITAVHVGGEGVMLATVRDITARIAAAAALRASSEQLAQNERFLRTVTDNLPGMVGYWDGALCCRFANKPYLDWFGLDAASMLGRTKLELLGEAQVQAEAPHLRAVFAGHAQQFESAMLDRAGAPRCIWTNYIPDFDEAGAVRGFYVLATDISERKQTELHLQQLNEQLVQALDGAEMASSAKSEFLANMSHEIRTPMNAIMGLARLLEEAPLERRERGYVAKMMMSTRSLLGILNDVLDFSKIEAGQLRLENTPFDLNQVLESIAVLVAGSAWHKGVEPVFAVAADVPLALVGDPMRLEQVLLNLMGNAIKFTAEGEVVLSLGVAAASAGGAAVTLGFAVRDSGIGIAPEQQVHMFAPFSQGDSSTSRRFGGTGLGLAICRRLVTLMGGEIGVDSALGHGATFRFALPFGAADDAARCALPAIAGLAGLRALVVDDNASAAAAVAANLRGFGWQVDVHASGAAGLEALRAATRAGERVDVLFVDSAMPDIDGVSMLTYARADPAIALPRVALMVAELHRERIDSLAADVALDTVLSKPVTPAALVAAIVELHTGQAPSSAELAPTPLAGRLQGVRVLLVEDNQMNQEVANYLLLHAGAQVEIAVNGRIAVAMLGAQPGRCDAVLMDIQMPEMNGYDATTAIRALGLADLPVIAMTANAMAEERQHAIDVGMNGHVAKPIDVDQLVATLNRLTPGGAERERRFGTHPAYAGSAAPAAATPLPAQIPGIDLPSTLPRFGGNFANFVTLFKRFESSQGGTLGEVRKLLIGADRSSAIDLVHRLRGVAANLGATGLAEHALEFEHALRGADDAELMTRLAGLDDELETVLEAARNLNLPAAAEPAAPLQDMDEVHDALADLLNLLQNNNLKAMGDFEALRAGLSASLAPASVSALAESIETLSFANAASQVQELLNRKGGA